jgi:GntP family gluconate:H+ symporter
MTLFIILLGVVFIVVAVSKFGLHPVLALLLASLAMGFAFGISGAEIVKYIGAGFGGILAGIGLIVVLGSIIGVALERSGAAVVVAERVLAVFGPRRPALAVSVIGALVSIPVFCDSGFILLSGLNKELARRSGAPLGVLSLALAAGLYTTHTLVPPTPGPIAAAGQLGADDYLGTIMLLGGLITIPVLLMAQLVAKRLGKNIQISDADEDKEDSQSSKENTTAAGNGKTISTTLAFLPLLLPILLIALGTLAAFFGWTGWIGDTLLFFGQPLVALLIGLLPAFLLARQVSANWSNWVADAIKMSGPILIITGAGGAFGAVLKASSLQTEINAYLGADALSLPILLVVAFLIAALLKTAQGSSTNALVITAGMVAPLVALAGIGTAFGFALVVLAIGGGAMTVSHANDSYFWVVTRFSGISVKDAYRTYTPLTGIMGLTVLSSVLLLSLFA